MLQDAAKSNSKTAYDKFVESSMEASQDCTLRGQLEFNLAEEPLELDDVEEAANIVRRFCTGNLSKISLTTIAPKVTLKIIGV